MDRGRVMDPRRAPVATSALGSCRVATLALLILSCPLAARPLLAGGDEISVGVRLTENRDYEAAVMVLDGVVQHLKGEPKRLGDLGRAYFYLGVARLGLGQETGAKQSFLDALSVEPRLMPDSARVPAEAVRLFEEARRESLAPMQPHGGRKRVLAAAGAGALLGGGVVALAEHEHKRGSSHRPPTVVFRASPEGIAIAGVTVLTFSASVASGDAVSYSWDFGDGGSATGPAANHVYAAEGTYSVTLTARDAQGASATALSPTTARTLSGRWLLSQGGRRFYERGYDLIQGGPALGGRPFSEPDQGCLGDITGSLTSPRSVVFQFAGCDGQVVVIVGTATTDLGSIQGTYTHPSGPPQPVTLSRQ